MKSLDVLTQMVEELLEKPVDDCVLWKRMLDKDGYGRVRFGNTHKRVHRVALELKIQRSIKDGLVAAHSCRNRACFNPAHLREATSLENSADMLKDATVLVGQHNGNSKLKNNDVPQIIDLLKTRRLSQTKIGKLFGVSQSTISSIKRNATWTATVK
jgi:predicted XRE-type DNA-binding protein